MTAPTRPDDVAAKYQKAACEAINNLAILSLVCVRLQFGKAADHRQREALALQGLDHQYQPDHEKPEAKQHRDQQQ
jgi:hypothetical protein